jgi:hypothetical protein
MSDYQHVLVAVDYTKHSVYVAEKARVLANKYQAKLTIKGKTNNLGTYDNPESARDIYNEAISLLNKGQSIEFLIKKRNKKP